METVFLGLGSNLGDRMGFLMRARNKLAEHAGVILTESLIYESEPVVAAAADNDQPWYLNQVLKLETILNPHELLKICEEIENDLGREKKNTFENGTRRYFPKTIDVDILIYGDIVISDPNLIVPHPRMKERRFVLIPLVEIAPEFKQLLNECQDSATVRLYEHPA